MMHIVDSIFMDELTAEAKASPRKRAHFNFHESLEDSVHRLCIGVEPGTYVRPHRHFAARNWELFTILRGRIAMLIFDEDGFVTMRVELLAGGEVCSLEIPADTRHAFVSLTSGSVVLEVKRGPYMRPADDDWMRGTPKEGEAGAFELELWYRTAQAGDKLPR
ncbi:MAG: WbuC family cupin fold metalloprotein [Victivallales bacterium]|nr:WbuC family cupin fold metalloprotein [Victivallales bacterium]